MTATIQVGTARSQPGEIVYGVFEAVPLPTGGFDHFPVIIAQGRASKGSVLWLTANIHGNEYDGLAVIHHVITPDLPAQLRGTVIAVPTLSPAGLRTGQRSPYYLRGKDPNRLFPARFTTDRSPGASYPTALELAYARLFERIDATASYLLDLHNYGIRSIPFVFRDPVLYREPRDRASAEKLQQTVGDMLDALGLTIVHEYASDEYLDLNLHRSVSGSALNTARIPAVTVEIGGNSTVNVSHVHAVAAGVRNVMRWAGMLPGEPEPIKHIPVIKPVTPVRRTTHPRVPVACLVHHLVQPGDTIRAGDPVARMVDIYGRPVGTTDGLLRTEYDGYVIGLFPGMALYPNDSVLGLAVPGSGSMIIQVD